MKESEESNDKDKTDEEREIGDSALVLRPTHKLHKLIYHKLERFRLRVAVTISNGSLANVMKPSIMMQMTLSEGRVVTFEVSIEQFHKLCY
jgi:hypothetical protein